MKTASSSALLIGVGNPYRNDDGVGIVVARRLKAHNPPGMTIIEQSGEGSALLDSWKDATNVFLVDAVHSGAPPGKVHRLDARASRIPSRFFHYSTHAFSVAEAVELARTLNQLPPHLILYGIEGVNFVAGMELSAEVEKAASALVLELLHETRALVGMETREP